MPLCRRRPALEESRWDATGSWRTSRAGTRAGVRCQARRTPSLTFAMTQEDLHPQLTTSLDGTVLTVTGEIDLFTAGRFSDALGQAIDGGRGIEVDLTAVDFMDSTGLRALLEARRQA